MDYSDLIERLKLATRGDRELDRAIAEMLGRKDDNGAIICAGYRGVCDFTGSIDAAIRLIEEYLPGWDWLVRTNDGDRGGGAFVNLTCVPDLSPIDDYREGYNSFPTWASTPALALVLATFNVLESRQRQSDVVVALHPHRARN